MAKGGKVHHLPAFVLFGWDHPFQTLVLIGCGAAEEARIMTFF